MAHKRTKKGEEKMTKNKLSEKEYNKLKEECKRLKILFPLPKSYEYYLELIDYVDLSRGYY